MADSPWNANFWNWLQSSQLQVTYFSFTKMFLKNKYKFDIKIGCEDSIILIKALFMSSSSEEEQIYFFSILNLNGVL